MTIKSVMKKILRGAIEWSVMIGATVLVCSVGGFWLTLGVMWAMCFITSVVTTLTILNSGKVTLVLPAPPTPPEAGRDDCDDFILSDAE